MELNRLVSKIAGLQFRSKFDRIETSRTILTPFAATYPNQQKKNQEEELERLKKELEAERNKGFFSRLFKK